MPLLHYVPLRATTRHYVHAASSSDRPRPKVDLHAHPARLLILRGTGARDRRLDRLRGEFVGIQRAAPPTNHIPQGLICHLHLITLPHCSLALTRPRSPSPALTRPRPPSPALTRPYIPALARPYIPALTYNLTHNLRYFSSPHGDPSSRCSRLSALFARWCP